MKTSHQSPLSIFACAFLIMGVLVVSPAHAGFQWVPAAPAEQMEAQAPAPVQNGQPQVQPSQQGEVGAPIPLQPSSNAAAAPVASANGAAEASKPANAAPADGHYLVAPKGMEPVKAPPASEPPASLQASAPSAPADAVVRGFANSVPLSVALRQVLPPDIGFSVSQDVSLGTLVSWKGGAPWRQVLKGMLEPAGLTAKEQDRLVMVARAEGVVAPADTSLVKPALQPANDAKSLPLASAPKELTPPAPLPAHNTPAPATTAPTMGYLVPPVNAMPVPSPGPATFGSDVSVDAWAANKGDSLQKVLKDWCHRANVDLSWLAEYDYPVQASISFSGNFEEAVRALLTGFEEARPQPVGELHSNQNAGQAVLVVQARGNNYSNQ